MEWYQVVVITIAALFHFAVIALFIGSDVCIIDARNLLAGVKQYDWERSLWERAVLFGFGVMPSYLTASLWLAERTHPDLMYWGHMAALDELEALDREDI
jgi:hypothetical protein